jgi:hypothetical protein
MKLGEKMKKIISILTLFVLLITSGCVVKQKGVASMQEKYKFDLIESSKKDFKNLDFEVQAVLITDFRNHPKLHAYVEHINGLGIKKSQDITLGEFPAFQVKIKNKFNHIISLKKSVYKLQDEHGTIYDLANPLLEQNDDGMIDHINSSLLYKGFIRWAKNDEKFGRKWNQEDYKKAMRQIPYINLKQLLPEMETGGYLFFDLGGEEQKVVNGSNTFKLYIYNVPVQLDATGSPTKTNTATFTFKKTMI